MKWAYSTENKIKASLTLLLLCGVVMFSNYRLEKLSGKVAGSVQTIYEDRLVVQDLIFSYGQLLDRLYTIYEQQPVLNIDKKIGMKANELKSQYLSTVMTEEEERVFISFSDELSGFLKAENNPGQGQIIEMRGKLEILEEIQMEEAKRQMTLINQAQGSQKLGFYLETSILVVLLIIIQALVVSNTGMKRVLNQNKYHLN